MSIKIVGGTDCIYCKKAKDACDMEDVTYEYQDLGPKDSGSWAKYFDDNASIIKNQRTLPVVFINDEYLGGYGKLIIYLEKLNGTNF
jgi:glutaredoxin